MLIAPVSVATSMIAVAPCFDGVGEAVGEDEAALGVRVDHLDRLAEHRLEHVAGLDRGAAGHVLGRGHDADDVDAGLELGDGAHGGDHRGAAGHVALHLAHVLRRA